MNINMITKQCQIIKNNCRTYMHAYSPTCTTTLQGVKCLMQKRFNLCYPQFDPLPSMDGHISAKTLTYVRS